MSEPNLRHVQCLDARGLNRMAYWERGEPANPRVLVCVHGLSRQDRDFDTLAHALRDVYRVVCPDVVGRGVDFLQDPMGYQSPAYVADRVTLLARLDAHTVHWMGTSMGALIGMGLASLPQTPIGRLVLNDVGPTIEPAAIVRIGTYLVAALEWSSIDEAAAYLLGISKGFGPHSREQWLALTRPMVKASGTGFKPHHDPAIAVRFKAVTPEHAAAGGALAKLRRHPLPHLAAVRRAVGSADTRDCARLGQRGPKAMLREFAGVGHAPTLIPAEQVAAVREFLLSP